MEGSSTVSLRSHIEALRTLARATVWSGQDSTEAYRLLTRVAAETLQVERVSIWLYNDDRSEIECSMLYEANPGRYSHGAILRREQFPSYFKAMDDDRPIVANDAYADRRTK